MSVLVVKIENHEQLYDDLSPIVTEETLEDNSGVEADTRMDVEEEEEVGEDYEGEEEIVDFYDFDDDDDIDDDEGQGDEQGDLSAEEGISSSSSSTIAIAPKKTFKSQKSSHADEKEGEYVIWGNVRRRKPKRIKRYIPAPRVIKADIRRKYNQMFGNCLNSYNLDLLNSFLDTFSTKDFTYNYYFKYANQPQASLANLTCNLELKGPKAFLWFIGGVQNLTPDRVVTYSDIKIHTFSNSAKSFIEATFEIEGNVLYNVKLPQLVKYASGREIVGDSANHIKPRGNKRKLDQQNQPPHETIIIQIPPFLILISKMSVIL